jgi:uncharacterized protein (DUF433 family)
MNNNQTNQIIGAGVYTLQEAALYSSISPHKLSRWIFGSSNCESVINSRLSMQRLISFYDLIQAMAVNRARAYGIPLPKIREAIKVAKKDYGVEFPLAYNHELWWFEKNLHIKRPDNSVIQVSGKVKGQQSWKVIVEPFKQDLRFNEEGLVEQYVPLQKSGRQIVLDPKRQFGQPLVDNTGYRADVLNNAFLAEESCEIVASSFNIDVKDVQLAVEYISSRKAA